MVLRLPGLGGRSEGWMHPLSGTLRGGEEVRWERRGKTDAEELKTTADYRMHQQGHKRAMVHQSRNLRRFVAQTSKSAVSRIPKPAGASTAGAHGDFTRHADWEVAHSADWKSALQLEGRCAMGCVGRT